MLQLFSVRVDFGSDKPGRLYGLVEAKGYGLTDFVSLFNRGEDESESQPIFDKGLVSLTDPSPYHLISATSIINMNVQLFVRIDDFEYKLSLADLFWDCSRPEYNKCFNYFQSTIIKEYDGSVKLYYIVLDRAIEATVELIWETPYDSVLVFGEIVAYYGDLVSYFLPPDYDDDRKKSCLEFQTFKCCSDEAEYCKARLFEASINEPVLFKDGKIPMKRSRLVVPNGGSLIIEAHISDLKFGEKIIDGTLEFESKLKDSSTGFIKGLGGSMGLKVDWKYQEDEKLLLDGL